MTPATVTKATFKDLLATLAGQPDEELELRASKIY
jgi:hypothetical protein